MTSATPDGPSSEVTRRERPMCDPTALTFAIDDPFAARAAATAAMHGASVTDGPLEAVLRHVSATPEFEVYPVFADRAVGVLGSNQARLAIADRRLPNKRLSGIHLLRPRGVPSERAVEIVAGWRRALVTDSRVAYAEHPMIAYPVLDLTTRDNVRAFVGEMPKTGCKDAVKLACNEQWGLRHCGFDCIWDELDTGFDPGPVGILDIGMEPKSSTELGSRVVHYYKPPGDPFPSTHPAAVAGIISAIRDGTDDERMRGCCSASLLVFSIYSTERRDAAALYDVMRTLGQAPVRVVNASFESECRDPSIDRMITQYVEDGMVFVAAMGNRNGRRNATNWPAAHEDVIAVGATQDLTNARYEDSCTGNHIFMAAPGVDILTLDPGSDSGYACINGTSLAAPHVTAAIWLALRQRPEWSAKEIRCLLQQSVQDPSRRWNASVGHGCLHVGKMAQLLREGACG